MRNEIKCFLMDSILETQKTLHDLMAMMSAGILEHKIIMENEIRKKQKILDSEFESPIILLKSME